MPPTSSSREHRRRERSRDKAREIALGREIFSRARFAETPSLGRMEELLCRLFSEDWWGGLNAIKVVGSSGKGTVATLLEAFLRSSGSRTGLYTSPHLRSFSERARVDGVPLGIGELETAMATVRPVLAELDGEGRSPLAFEAMTALALRAFEESQVEAVVAEAGMGGRHDPTRLIPGHLCVLVSVDLEHTRILGSTREEIADEKSDLAEAGGCLVVGDLGGPLVDRVRQRAARRQIETVDLSSAARWSEPRPIPGGQVVDMEIEGLALPGLQMPLFGEHQVESVALAILAYLRWKKTNGLAFDVAEGLVALRQSLAEVHLAGRFERIGKDPDVWIDIGHTPAAAEFTAQTVSRRFPGQRVILLLGVSRDKNPSLVAPPLARVADRIIVTRAHHRGGDMARVVQALPTPGEPGAVEVESIVPLGAALERALELAHREQAVLVVAGGLFLAIEASEILAGRDPRELFFF